MDHKPLEAIMRQHNHFAKKPQQNQWLLTRLQKYKISVSYVTHKGLFIDVTDSTILPGQYCTSFLNFCFLIPRCVLCGEYKMYCLLADEISSPEIL